MDAFLAKLSYHATSYAIRSCLALTSTYAIQQGSRLLKTVDDDDPLRAELGHLQRRLARKIELISPILESIDFRYTRGNSALETVVRVSRELRDDIDTLGKRLELVALSEESTPNGGAKDAAAAAVRRVEIRNIVTDMKHLIVSIDDSIPLVNLWVSAIGGIQEQPSGFSPSRLLQASMLVNVGDTQFILDPSQPMQIGPDFTLSLYMLFRGHASSQDTEEPYGMEDGQRKPMWQEVIHKARVRLCRMPLDDEFSLTTGIGGAASPNGYSYQLQVVEDLDDGRVHAFDDGEAQPTSYDGIRLAGIRDLIPVHQISKMFYADVGRILNIGNDEGASSNPVLLTKRDVKATPNSMVTNAETLGDQSRLIEGVEESILSDSTLSEGDSQDEIDRQLQQENEVLEMAAQPATAPERASRPNNTWSLPQDLDPEWIALEVFEISDDTDSTDDDDDEPTPDDEHFADPSRHPRPKYISRPSVDSNLVTQLNRMSIASSRPSSRDSHSQPYPQPPPFHTPNHAHPTSNLPSSSRISPTPAAPTTSTALSPTLIERSPFGAIKTSLSLLEMLLRLTSLQEFEQTTHLAIPDHVLKFYLDESASTSGLHGRERWAARAEAEGKVGFDPYADSPGRRRG